MTNVRRRPVNQAHQGDSINNNNGQSNPQQDAEESQSTSPTAADVDTDEKPTLSPLVKLKRNLSKPRGKRWHSVVFMLGGLFGIFVAVFFANHNEVISLDALMDLNLDSLIDVMPQGILRDAREFTVRFFFSFFRTKT
jgi:phospholipid:diacylglycerol acyltransferase